MVALSGLLHPLQSSAVEHATISVPESGTATILNGTSGFAIDTANAVTGELPVRIGADAASDLAEGVLVGYSYTTARTTGLTLPGPTESLRAAVSTVFDDDPDSLNTRAASGALSLVSHRAGADSTFSRFNGNARFNTDIAAAYFPFSDGWIGGTLLEQGSGETGSFFAIAGGNGVQVSDATANFYEVTVTGSDPSVQTRAGGHKLTIPGVTDTRRQGFLFVNYSGGEDQYALSTPSADGLSYTVETRQAAQDGAQDTFGAFSYVFIPRGTPGVVAARVNSGDASSPTDEPVTMISSGGDFTLTRTDIGQYRLSIDGHTPSSGTLLVQANGGNASEIDRGSDNIMTYEPDGNGWIIQSRDLPSLQNFQDSTAARGSFFEFAFLPNSGGPSGPGEIPSVESVTNFSPGRVIGWNAEITEVVGSNSFGDMFATVTSSTSDVTVTPAQQNRGDLGFIVDGAYLSRDEGALFVTPRQGFRNNSSTGGNSDYGLAGVDRESREWGIVTNTADVFFQSSANGGELNIDVSAVFFGKDSGFVVGNGVQEDEMSNVTNVDIAGVDAATDGVLFANFVGNDDNFLTVEVDGAGWDIKQYDNDTGAEAANAVNYVYLPYDADNLVAGRVAASGTVVNSTDGSGFSLTRQSAGEYLLTVAGKTPDDGMLLLNADGADNASADNALSYEADGSAFRIFGFDLVTQTESDNFAIVDLEDTAFSFAFIDFDTPPSLGGPLLSGDFNGDGMVDGADYTVWRDNFGATEDGSILAGNGNGGLVDDTDYDDWVANFGATASVATAVPEPTAVSVSIVVLSLLGIRLRKTRRR